MNGEKPGEPAEGVFQSPHNDTASRDKAHNQTSKSWTNPRKRPYRQDSASFFRSMSNEENVQGESYNQDLHAAKRNRGAEWPLKDINPSTDSDNDHSKTTLRSDKRSSSSSMRPSKFCEGSMNDKISQRPPSLYTRQEEAMEQYAKSQENQDVNMNYEARSESQKPSGMFRFGKAIANALKPFTVWPNSIRKEREKEWNINPEKAILHERQAKAAEAYAELKKSGYKGIQAFTHREEQSAPLIKHQNVGENPTISFRDSGIDMDVDDYIHEHNPNDQLIGFTEALLVPPPAKGRSVSPFSNASSARKSSLQIRKPSLQGLKKVTSQIHLSPVKKQPETGHSIPSERNLGADSAAVAVGFSSGSGLRTEPSKKDLAKQYKLGKKVSDLENKLESARRELEMSISNAPPIPEIPAHIGRKPFKPGALPSLPSERDMSPRKEESQMPTYHKDTSYHESDSAKLAPKRSTGRVALEADVYKPGTDIDDVLELEAAKGKKRGVRPTKSQESTMQTPTGVHKRLPRVPSKPPRKSPLNHPEKKPPVPSVAKAVNPKKDHESVAHDKATDHTSVSHVNRAPSPFLGPPASSSPIRTRSKTSKRGISPPPPSLISPKKSKADTGTAADTEMTGMEPTAPIDAEVDPTKSTTPIEQPPTPAVTDNPHEDTIMPDAQKDDLESTVTDNPLKDTSLPNAQKDDFEWPEDVF